MQESALGSVFIFQKRGIGLDNYKSKESLSRAGVQPQIFTLLVINQRQEEQDLNRTLMLKNLIVL